MRSPFQKIAVFDIETGGLKKEINPMVEVAIVIIDLEEVKIIDTYTDIIKPYNEELFYDPEAEQNAHKLSVQYLTENGIDSFEVINRMIKFFKKHTKGNSKPILAGHNIDKFDTPFIQKFFTDHGQDLTKWVSSDLTIDTLKWARLRWFDLVDFQLGTCVNESELILKGAHRALPDTIANAEMLVKMLKSLRGEGSQKTKYVRRKFDFQF